MKPIHAIYENGVFRPTEPVDLPEHATVEVEVRKVLPMTNGLIGVELPSQPLPESLKDHPMRGVYAVLARRFDTGEVDLAERHDELDP